MANYRAFVALFVAVGVGAVPYQYRQASPDSCASKCSGLNTKFQYKPGTEYRYRYEVSSETNKPLLSDESTKLHIETIAEIEAGEECEYVLRLRDVNIFQSVPYKENLVVPDREQELKSALEKNVLRFSFDDGVIADVCPDESEEPWPLNFKKGLLSAFQNTMNDFSRDSQILYEEDVSGLCETEYTSAKTWGWTHETSITKSKQLTGCTNRAGYRSIAQMVPYHVPSDIQSIPILKSSQDCEYKVSAENILISAECSENHRFMPFSREESGARTTVTQKLTFQNQAARGAGRSPSMSRRDTLLFAHGSQPRDSTRQAAEQILKELCEQTKYDIRPETPRLFTELTEVVKGLTIDDLENLYRQLKDDVICPRHDKAMRFFLNSLPNARTLGPIKMMVKLIQKDEVQKEIAFAWIKSLTIVKDATEETVQAVKPLLDGQHKEDAMLPVTSVISSFCRNDAECQSNYHVEEVRSKLTKAVGYSCSVDESNLKLVLMSLRALGNIRGLDDKTAMAACLASSNAPLEVKVAAADGYRRSACPNEYEKDDALWTVLKDSSADMEIRIVSYLSIMRCSDQSTLDDIANYLKEMEEDDQVGVFIYSHLKNIMQSSDPHKKDLAKAISKLELRQFELKGPTQSRNMEASVLINKLNLGATIDSNLIMSPNAPLPRAARVNVSLELFGNAVNLIEIGGRVEGLETILHDVFGFKEPMKPKSDRKKIDDVRSSGYVRIFGNEVFYKHRLGTEDLIDTSKAPTRKELFAKLAKKQTVNFSVSRNVLDATVIFPTAAGLPLEIRANSSATIDLNIGGSADFTKMNKKGSMKIDGGIQFGAAMELTGSMSVDAFVTKLGLRIRNTIHSSTEIKGRIDVVKGRLLSVDIDAPPDGMEIFQGKTEFFLNYNGVEKKQDYAKDMKTLKLCTSEKAAQITGAQLCGELGHTHFAIKLNKKDTQTSYKFFNKFIPTKKTLEIQYQVNTPGSQVNRLVSMDITFGGGGSEEDLTMDVQIVSPWKKIDYNAVFAFTRDMMRITSSAIVNDKDKYAHIVELKVSKDDSKKQLIFTPFIEVTRLGKISKVVSGQIVVRKGLRMDLDLEVQKPDESPRIIEGQVILSKNEKRIKWVVTQNGNQVYMVNVGGTKTLTRGKKGSQYWDYKPEIIIKSPDKVYLTLDSSVHYGYKKPDKTFKGDVTVQVLSKKPTSLNWSFVFKKGNKGKFIRDIGLKVKSALVNGNLDITGYVAKSGVTSNRVKGFYNIPGVDKNSFLITGKLSDMSKNALKKYSYKGSFTNKKFPEYNSAIETNVEHKRKHSSINFEIRYGENHNLKRKRINFSSSIKREIKDRSHVDVVLRGDLNVPEKNVDFNIVASHHRTPTVIESKVDTKLWPIVEHPIKAEVKLHDKSTKLRHIDGQATFQTGNKKYALSSNVNQKSRNHVIHTAKAILPNGEKYMVTTDIKTPTKYRREVSSSVNIHGMKNIQISGKANLIPTSAQLSGNIMYGSKNYGVNIVHKHAKDAYRKLRFEVERPDRKVEMHAHVKKGNDKYDGDFLLNWDARKKVKGDYEIKFDGFFKHQMTKDSRLANAQVNLKTPFEPLRDVGTIIKYENDPKQLDLHTKITWDGKHKKIASNAVIQKPLNPYNIKMKLSTHTHYKQYKHMELDIDHTLDQASLATILKGSVGEDKTELRIKGEDKGQQVDTNLHGTIDLKTPFKNLKHVHVTADHKREGDHYETRTNVNHDGKKYSADIKADIESTDSLFKHSGRLHLKHPKDTVVVNWKHDVTIGQNVDSKVNAKWGQNKKLDVELKAIRENDDENSHLLCELNIKSPFQDHEDINVKLDHSFSANKIDCKAHVIRNHKQMRAYQIFFERNGEEKKARVYIFPSPDREPIQGEVSLFYGGYPKTYSAWLQWDPSSRIDSDGSINAQTWNDLEFAGKLTTPFEMLNNINVRGSHKHDNKEYISHANVVYGVGKTIDIERRIRNDDEMKMFRLKLETPFESLKNADAGIQVDIRDDGLNGKADIEALPHLKKYDGFITFTKNGDDRSGKLELNTPKAQPLLKIRTRSNKNEDSSRTSHIEIIPDNKGVYSFKSTHRFEKPYLIDIGLSSPNPDVRDVGFKITSDPNPTSVDWKGIVVYKTNKQIEIKVNADWEKDVEGNIVVKTPFRGYKYNYVTVRRTGESSDFTRHSEAKIGKSNFISDLSFSKSDNSASVTLSASLTSPSIERLSLSLSRQYDIDSEGVKHIASTFETRRGEKMMNGKVNARIDGIKDLGITMSLETSFEKLKTLNIMLERQITDTDMTGKFTLDKTGEISRNVALSVTRVHDPNELKISYKHMQDMETLVDVLIERERLEGEAHGKLVITGSLLPSISATVDHQGTRKNFNTKVRIVDDEGGNLIDQEITFKVEKSKVDIDARLSYKYGDEDHTHKFTLNKVGGRKNFKIDVTRAIDGQEVIGKIVFKTKNKISGLAEFRNLQGNDEVRSIKFEHSGDSEQFLTSGRIQLKDDEIIVGKVKFYRDDKWKHVEMTADLTTPYEGHTYKNVEYRHNLETDVRSSVSVIAKNEDKQLSLNIIRQIQPSRSINVNVKTPFEGYKKLVYSVQVDKRKMNAKLIPRDDLEFTITGTHDLSDYPVNIRYTITTPLDCAKTIEVSLVAQPYDRTLDITVERSDDKKTTVHTEVNIKNKLNSNINFELNANLDETERIYEPFTLNFRRAGDPQGARTGHLEIGKYLISDVSLKKDRNWRGDTVVNGDLEWSAPALKDYLPIQKWHGSFELTSSHSRKKSKIEVSADDKVRLDVDLDVKWTRDDIKISAEFRDPRPMEYSFRVQEQALGRSSFEREGDLVLNWNKEDDNSNVRVSTNYRDESRDDNVDKSLTVTVVRPLRTVQIEHSAVLNSEKVDVSGKFYWDKDQDRKISYQIDLTSNEHRQDKSYEALIKLGLPSRTVAFTGSVSDDTVTRRGNAAFLWDMGRDEDKQIGIKTTFSRGTYKKADITLTMPAELQVNTEMILNQGNTLFDGKTDISYSRDSRKTLTVFSKIRDIKSYSSGFFSENTGGFNYSVEFGVSHPETRTDMTLDSHIGKVEGLLTSSLGLSYMTSRRQVVNMALSTEIDRIKKQISLNAECPEHTLNFNSRMVSEKPLQVEMRSSVDGEEKFLTNINIDKENKQARLEIGEPGNVLAFEHYYPNSSAWQATLTRKQDTQGDRQEAQLVLRLTSPKVLHTALDWRPEAVEEAREWLVNRVKTRRELIKTTLKELSTTVQNELTQKHEDIVESIAKDTKPLMSFVEDELERIGNEIGSAKQALKKMKKDNDFFLGDITKAGKRIQERYSYILERLDNLQQKAAENRRWLIERLSERMQKIKNSEFRQNVRKLVSNAINRRIEMVDRISSRLLKIMSKIDKKLLNLKNLTPSTLYEALYNHKRLEFLRAKVDKILNTDFEIFFQERRNQIKERFQERLHMLQEYLPEPLRERLEEVAKHVQGVFDYWVDQELLAERLRTLLTLLKEEIKEELTKYTYSVQMLGQNPFTVYDPENGIIRANFDLPIALKRLDELPEIEPYMDEMRTMAQRNRDRFANAVYNAWQSNETSPNHQVIAF